MSAPKVKSIYVKNYRSIGDQTVSIRLPDSGPLVVLGENNAGKSNISKAIELILGERWPGSIQLDDHDFHGRDGDGLEVQIAADVEGVTCPKCGGQITRIHWKYDEGGDQGPVSFTRNCSTCPAKFMSNEIRDQLGCLVIGADRRLSYQLSYTSVYVPRPPHDAFSLSDEG